MKHDPLRSSMKNARGLGSAKSGFSHWWAQRLTAIALVPLTIWFVVQLLTHLLNVSRFGVADWFENPLNAVLFSALLGAMIVHAKLGLQVVIEDYIHKECVKIAAIILLSFASVAMGAFALFAVVKLHFFGI
jgi:succinate dehydrogenase / fumarate reductase, membrane anchor subunit